jgi:hypothetical protein
VKDRDDLPDVVLTKRDALVLFDAAIERDDFEGAGVWADLLLGVNDQKEDA